MKHKIFNISLLTIFIVLLITFFKFTKVFNYLNNIIWAIATILIIIGGFFFTFKLHFATMNIKKMLTSLKSKSKEGISSFESLTISLAGRVGVGSLSGVALAIYIGGPGTIFWMWVTAIIASSNTFVESVLGVIYQRKDSKFINVGGPSYYIKQGLNQNDLAIFYAIMIIISYIGGFLTIQSNTIVKSINTIYYVNPIIIIMIISIFTALVIFNGVKQIAIFSSKIVPIMGILYLLLGIIVIIKNFNIIPSTIWLIIKSAFNFKSITLGFLSTLIIGVQRGIFSNESGLGTSAIASSTTFDNPIKQGYIQVLGIYITTIIICSITALIILTSNYEILSLTDVNGIEITSYAFKYHLGNMGNIVLSIIVILFAFSTIISGYYYGESSLKFLKPNISKKSLDLFKTISIILISLGGVIASSFLWNLVDIFVAILVIINIYALFYLYKDVIFELKESKRK